MQKFKKYALFVMVFLFLSNSCLADNNSSENINPLKGKTPDEILDFYIKNPDYGKKRLDIHYPSYLSGDYVVWRGELVDQSGVYIKDFPINYRLNSDSFATVTTVKGIFNLEIKKTDISENKNYILKINVGDYSVSSIQKSGSGLISDSIYHFKIIKNLNGYKIENIYGSGFINKNLTNNSQIIEIYSFLGMSGIHLLILFFIISTIIGVLIFKNKLGNKD